MRFTLVRGVKATVWGASGRVPRSLIHALHAGEGVKATVHWLRRPLCDRARCRKRPQQELKGHRPPGAEPARPCSPQAAGRLITGRFLSEAAMAAAPTEAQKREAINKADSDLQFVLGEAGLSLDAQWAVVQRHSTLRRFQAIADSRSLRRGPRARQISVCQTTILKAGNRSPG